MTITMNPSMPHPHHLPLHPGERPHVSFNDMPGPINHDRLANQMNNLRLNEDRFSPSNEARSRDIIAGTDIDSDAGTSYVGYTFFKAEPTPGYSQTWKKVEKTRMNLRQHDLAEMVRKRSKRVPVSDQYRSLTLVKRPHVDRLIEELRQDSPQLEWMCVYVKEETRDVKGKTFSRDYETTSMDVILMGKASNRVFSETRAQLRDQRPNPAHRPMPEMQHRPPVSGPYNEPRGGLNQPPMSMPPQMPQTSSMPPMPGSFPQQHGPPPAHHPAPGHGPGPGPAPFRPPPQNVMREPPHPEQANWAPNVPRGPPQQPQQLQQPPPPPPIVHNNVNRPLVPDPRMDRPDQRRPAVSPDRKNHMREAPHHNVPRNPQVKVGGKRDRSPKQRFGSEPDLVPDESSSEDEIMTPDYDDDSEAEFSSRGKKGLKTPQPWRGSLYRKHPSTQPRSRYRTHHRKEPIYPKDPLQLGDREHKRYRDDDVIDIYPGDGRHGARRSNRYHGVGRHLDVQPRIIQQQPSSDDLDMNMNHSEVLMDNARRGARNDLRSRMLKDWQQDLEQREHLFEYKQMLRNDPGRMDGGAFPSRSRSLREPHAYHHGYAPRALYY